MSLDYFYMNRWFFFYIWETTYYKITIYIYLVILQKSKITKIFLKIKIYISCYFFFKNNNIYILFFDFFLNYFKHLKLKNKKLI